MRTFVAGLAAMACLFVAAPALAAPVTWTLSGVTTNDGRTITGSFTYDADTNTYSNRNIISTGGIGPFTAGYGAGNATAGYFTQTPAGVGQNGIALISVAPKTNVGGTLVLTTGNGNGGLFTCTDGACNVGTYTANGGIAGGSITAPTPVPTMGEWAMILMGLMLAGGAAVMVQRRRLAA